MARPPAPSLRAGRKTTAHTFDTFAVLQGAPAFILTGAATKTTGLSSANGATVMNSLTANVGGNGATIFRNEHDHQCYLRHDHL